MTDRTRLVPLPGPAEHRAHRLFVVAVIFVCIGVGIAGPCLLNAQTAAGPVGPADNDALRTLIEEVRQKPTAVVRGKRLLQPEAVFRFFEARSFAPPWKIPAVGPDILKAIRAMEADGLSPDDYHLAAIGAALEAHAKAPTSEGSAALQVLVADAAAAMVDHVRYGKVRPSSLDRRWNVDPRVGAPPLHVALDQITRSASIDAGIEALKPHHFIYQGLKQALARVRTLAAAGGWPAIPVGAPVKPGASDPRLPAIRRRLAVTGELAGSAPVEPTTYGPELETAVKNFQAHHRLTDDGVIGRATVEAMNVTADARAAQLRVNLERARWVIGGLRDSFLLVNLPAFKAYVIRDGKNVWEARTQIGRAARKTPTFRADLRYLVLNPDWTVPPTILAQDVLAGMRSGENTIARKKLRILDAQGRSVDPTAIDWQAATPTNFRYTLRQPPGADNALGRVKFIFPNEYSIFLHDTPSQELFASDLRTFSSGCIRVANALDLARLLLEGRGNKPSADPAGTHTWTAERIDEAVRGGSSQTVFLDQPLPVLIVYWTASIGAGGDLRFAKDVYGLDAPVLRALNAPVAPKP
jgi:murein L,D-transpeptidase YcbB/YkuD